MPCIGKENMKKLIAVAAVLSMFGSVAFAEKQNQSYGSRYEGKLS